MSRRAGSGLPARRDQTRASYVPSPAPAEWWGLKETVAKLATGRMVFNRNDAVVWLIEQLDERAQAGRMRTRR